MGNSKKELEGVFKLLDSFLDSDVYQRAVKSLMDKSGAIIHLKPTKYYKSDREQILYHLFKANFSADSLFEDCRTILEKYFDHMIAFTIKVMEYHSGAIKGQSYKKDEILYHMIEFHFLKEQPDKLIPYLESLRDIDPQGTKRVLTERFIKTDFEKNKLEIQKIQEELHVTFPKLYLSWLEAGLKDYSYKITINKSSDTVKLDKDFKDHEIWLDSFSRLIGRNEQFKIKEYAGDFLMIGESDGLEVDKGFFINSIDPNDESIYSNVLREIVNKTPLSSSPMEKETENIQEFIEKYKDK
jgi:hypothetical protein